MQISKDLQNSARSQGLFLALFFVRARTTPADLNKFYGYLIVKIDKDKVCRFHLKQYDEIDAAKPEVLNHYKWSVNECGITLERDFNTNMDGDLFRNTVCIKEKSRSKKSRNEIKTKSLINVIQCYSPVDSCRHFKNNYSKTAAINSIQGD